MSLNEKVIGKKYIVEPKEITAHESIYYALAVNEDNDAYFDNRRDGGIIAPPMYAVNYAGAPVAQMFFDQETGLNMAAVLHYSQEFEWLLPVKPGDVITTEGEISHIEVREKGGIMGFRIVSRNQEDKEVVRGMFEFFDRSAGSGKPGDKKSGKQEPGEVLWTQQMKVRNGQSFIYAEPSGDHNPIHINNDFAVKVGLPGIILQGLCTMAFTHRAAVDNLCGNERDPLKLKRFHVRFSRPVLPGQDLMFQGYAISKDKEGAKYGITVKNSEGSEVLRDAWCIIEE